MRDITIINRRMFIVKPKAKRGLHRQKTFITQAGNLGRNQQAKLIHPSLAGVFPWPLLWRLMLRLSNLQTVLIQPREPILILLVLQHVSR